MNGTDPSRLIAVHISVTIKKPSRLLMLTARLWNGSQNASPATNAIANAIEKRQASPSA
jgi:hypothetical protein